MNKEYMIYAIKQRIEELESVYRNAVNNRGITGTELSKSAAAVTRHRAKRDICCCRLMLELLNTSKAVFITDEDAITGFTYLIGDK